MLAKDEVKQKQKEALKLLAKGKYDEALKIYEEIAEVVDDADIYNTIGDIYVRKQDIQKAIDNYTKAFRKYREGEYYESAKALAKKILRYDKGRKDLYLELAELNLETWDIDGALENLTRLLDEGLPPSFLDRAFLLMNRIAEKIQEDEEHLARFERLFLKFQEMAESLGELTLESGEFQEFYEDDVSKIAEFMEPSTEEIQAAELISEVEEKEFPPGEEKVKKEEEVKAEVPSGIAEEEVEETMIFFPEEAEEVPEEVPMEKIPEEAGKDEIYTGEETRIDLGEEPAPESMEKVSEEQIGDVLSEEGPAQKVIEEEKEIKERPVFEEPVLEEAPAREAPEVPKELIIQVVKDIKQEILKEEEFPFEEGNSLERGIEFLEMGFHKPAIKELQKALEDPRTRLKAMQYLGRAFLEIGEFDFAEKILRKGVEEGGYDEKEYLGIYYYLAQTLELKGMEKEALHYYEEIYLLDAGFRDVESKIHKLRRVL